MKNIILALPLFLSMHSIYAQNVMNSGIAMTSVQNTILNNTRGNAADWSLTTDEWNHYQQLMQGPDGHWYPNLTPPEVLGLNAQTSQEQQHFAEIVAHEEHDKLARELLFDRAVHQAMLKLYANEPVIAPFNLTPFNPVHQKIDEGTQLQSGDHLVLFIDIGQGLDFLFLPKLLNQINNNPNVILDIFCVGETNDSAIRNFAKLNGIPMDLVMERRITLNHDNGQLQKTIGNAELPQLLLVHQGQSKKISVWSFT